MNSIKKLPQTIIYAARINDRDVLRSSSSGGLFTVLSDPFLRCGGAIVCSVYQYDSHRIEFCLITEKSKRDCAKGSKYIQSSMGDIFRKAHEWLMEDAGRKLLFVGTGCQAEGFRKYAEQTGIRQRCTVVDIICHGAPSPLLWREYVTHLECIHKGKVTNLTFKDKRNGWLRPTACVKIFNKEISIADYVRFFFSDVPLRPSCYQCPFAKIERETDMTIGDFWHIEEKKTEFYDSEGNSLLLIHTEKGSAFFEQCKNTLQIERSTADECWQLNLERPTERPPHRDEILQECLTYGTYQTIVKYYGEKRQNLLMRIVRKIKKLVVWRQSLMLGLPIRA